MRRGAALAVAMLAAVTFAGCGVTTVETTFDDALVREVGAGSVAAQGLYSSVAGLQKVNERFNEPSVEKLMTSLVDGRLDKLTAADIARLARVNRLSRKRFSRLLRQLDGVEQDMRESRVKASAHDDLSDGATEFVGAWNGYLQGNAERTASLRDGLGKFNGTFDGFDKLLAAALDTARVGNTRHFEPLRDRFIDDAGELAEAYSTTTASLLKNRPADRRLVDLLNENAEARVILNAVNKKYPAGYLADFDEK